jgi:hypothetical protein
MGFGYDEEMIAEIGGSVWPGVAAAEGEFARRAQGQGAEPEELRRRMRAVYRERMGAQRALLRGGNAEARESAEEAGPES